MTFTKQFHCLCMIFVIEHGIVRSNSIAKLRWQALTDVINYIRAVMNVVRIHPYLLVVGPLRNAVQDNEVEIHVSFGFIVDGAYN